MTAGASEVGTLEIACTLHRHCRQTLTKNFTTNSEGIKMVRSRSKQRIFVLISAVFFFGSAAANAVHFFKDAVTEPATASVETNPGSGLVEQERGYELVLQREPNNQVALEGLANTRLEMNNSRGAIAPLEQLVKLHPDRADYVALLTEAHQKAGDRPAR